MSRTLDTFALSVLRLWKPGPISKWSATAFISLTDFHVYSWRDLPSAWQEGIRIRRAWPSLEGAVGLWLWALPWARRSGSVSIWRSEEDLRAFVRWERHRQTMRRFRHTGHLTSTSWSVPSFERSEVWREAVRKLASLHPELSRD